MSSEEEREPVERDEVDPVSDRERSRSPVPHKRNHSSHKRAHDANASGQDGGRPRSRDRGQDGGRSRSRDRGHSDSVVTIPPDNSERRPLSEYTIPKRPTSPAVQGLSDNECSEGELDPEEDRFYQESDGGHDLQPLWRFRDNEPQSCFDPLRDESLEDDFSEFQLNYIGKYLTNVGHEPKLVEEITKDLPVPKLLLAALKKELDPDMLELVPNAAQRQVKEWDGVLKILNNRTNQLLGPVLSMWHRSIESEDRATKFDAERLIGLIGQMNTEFLFYRRKQVLCKVVEPAKAIDLVKRNDKVFTNEETRLFGDKFYEALHRNAVGKKHLREARRELARVRPYSRRNPFIHGRQGPSASYTPTAAAGGDYRGEYREYRGESRGRRRGGQPFSAGSRSRGRGRGRAAESRGGGTPRYVTSSYSISHTGKNSIVTGVSESKPVSGGPRVRRGEVSTACGKLGKNIHRRVGVTNRKRVPFGTRGDSPTIERAPLATFFVHPKNTNSSRNSEVVRKRGDRVSFGIKRSTSQFPILETKKRRVHETHHKSKTAQPVCSIPAFQDGRYASSTGYGSTKRVLHQDRPQRRVLHNSGDRETSEVPQVQMGGPVIPVSNVSVRARVRTTSIHKVDETGRSRVEKDGCKDGDLLGRHDSGEPRPVAASYANAEHDLAAGTPRVPHKPREIGYHAQKQDRIPGLRDRLRGDESEASHRKDERHHSTVHGAFTRAGHHSPRIGSVDREASRGSQSSDARTSALPKSPDAEDESIDIRGDELRNAGDVDSRVQSRNTMVGRRTRHLEREFAHQTLCRFDVTDDQRCVNERLGSDMRDADGTGDVVERGEERAHQRAGDESGVVRDKSVHQNLHEQTCAHQSRQQDDCRKHQQEGRHQIQEAAGSSEPDLGVLSIQNDHSYGRISAGKGQPGSGLSIPPLQRQQQLAAQYRVVPDIERDVGTFHDRPLCRQVEQTTTEVCQLETRPGSRSDRCVHHSVGPSGKLRVSTVLHDKQMPGQATTRTKPSRDNHANLANATVVRQTAANGNRLTNFAAADGEPTAGPSGPSPSTDTNRPVAASGMEHIQRSLSEQGFSAKARQLVTGARRKGTQAVYNAAWKKWHSWCVERQIDSFQADLADVGNFLAQAVEDGREYSTINGYRSAISLMHPEIEGHKVGQHPTIIQLMKGIFNQKPPTPKYSETWDVKLVLDYIKNKGDNDCLSDKTLTWKTAMLIALTNASRAHEIKNINPGLAQDFGDKIVLDIAKLTKSKRQGKQRIMITLLTYEKDDTLDPVACYRAYLKRTAEWRNTDEQKEQLFLSLVKPHSAVTTSTVSRWLREIMTESGVNTELFKAHSIRGASTSRASKEGLSVGQIIQKANWSRATTFQKIYCRNIQDSETDFQDKVLNL